MPGSNSRSSSVVMAFWPDRGQSLANINYSRKSVGIIQYFVGIYSGVRWYTWVYMGIHWWT